MLTVFQTLLSKSCLLNRWQRTKVNTSFSSWSELLLEVPQGSALLLLLFSIYVYMYIYINDLFYITELTNVCNNSDGTAFHACDLDISTLLNILEHDSMLTLEWFKSNYMVDSICDLCILQIYCKNRKYFDI